MCSLQTITDFSLYLAFVFPQSAPDIFIHKYTAMFWEVFIKWGQSFATAMPDPTTLITLQRSQISALLPKPHSEGCTITAVTHSHKPRGSPTFVKFCLRNSCKHTLYWINDPSLWLSNPKSESVLLNKCFFLPTLVVDEQQNFFPSQEIISSHVSHKPLA